MREPQLKVKNLVPDIAGKFSKFRTVQNFLIFYGKSMTFSLFEIHFPRALFFSPC